MRRLVTVLLLICARQSNAADLLIGEATVKYLDSPKYQPGSCATQPQEESKQTATVCIDMWPWGRYRVAGFRDIDGTRHDIGTVVLTAHQAITGRWLLVLEKLSPEEARAFGAQYKARDRSRIMQVACLREPIERYREPSQPVSQLHAADQFHCYDMLDLSRAK